MSNLKELSAALVQAQTEIKNATLNKINPHYKSKYADLAEIRDCTIPVLAKHGLGIMQLTAIQDGQVVLITRMIHKSGEFIESVYPLNADPLKPQAMGSAMTYARRYCLAAICGIAAEEDDDANTADKNQRKAVNKTAKPKADSRAPFLKLEAEIRKHTDLDFLDNWWNDPLVTEQLKTMPEDWQKLLFIEFIKHGLAISESDASSSAFKIAYASAISKLTDIERQGLDDANYEYSPLDAG